MIPTAQGTWNRLVLKLAMAVALALALGTPARADGDAQAKLSLIFKSAKCVTWPKDKMRLPGPFVIGVIGQSDMSGTIQEATGGKKMKDREVVVKNISTPQEIQGCHVLFVSRSEDNRVKDILHAARKWSVLTVGETDYFEKEGGAVRFYFQDGVIHFHVNRGALRSADLAGDADWIGMGQQTVRNP